ncbi:hypothetical protein CNMCM5623_001810 [Aspergillus felis]|uniref:C2H2-type domain-containing protein n=1 Tax=Aspergillus felis TaxID=1287682 RepID=A0A8H6QAM7_9EURO|nr:hypothetical protein CNMCM5623_001810 [Aspergillus felis]
MTVDTPQDVEPWVPLGAIYEESLQDLFEPSEPVVFIAVMGMTGAGKSTFISHCTDEEVAISEPGALQSCTQEVRIHRCKHFSPHANVYLVDTPGFDDTNRKDTDILKEIATWLTETYKHKIRLRGILYLHRISDNRMGGCARRNLSMFKKLCGHEGIKSVIFLTTFWEKVDESDGDSREEALKTTDDFWGFFVRRGARVRRHWNNRDSALSAIQEFVPVGADKPPEEMKMAIQTEMVDSGKNLDQTSAGQELQSELQKEREKMQQEMKERELEMKEAIASKDKELIEILRQEQEKQAEDFKRRDMELQELKISMERMHEEKIQRLEARLLQQQNENREHREETDRMYRRYQEELQWLRGERDNYASRMDGLSQQISDLKNDRSARQEADTNQTCPACHETFISTSQLFEHIQGEHPLNAEEEEYEDEYAEQPSDGIHHQVDPYLTCLTCEEDFYDRDDLFEHIEDFQHGIDLVTGKPEPYTRPARFRPWKDNWWTNCLACGKYFSDRNDLFEHIEALQHGRDINTGKPEPYRRAAKSKAARGKNWRY